MTTATSDPRSKRGLVKSAIIIVDFAFVNGGNGQVGLSSSVALAQSGIETVVFAATGPVAPFLIGVQNLRVICLDQPEFIKDSNIARGALRGLWNFKARRALMTLLKTFDPSSTIVHMHSWTKSLSSSVASAIKESGFSLAVTIHDYFAFCPNGSFYDHQKEAPCRLEPMSLACISANCDPRSRAQKAYRVARQVVTERFAGIPRSIKYYIAVSPFSRAIAEPHLGNTTIFDVANPIEATQHRPADPGGTADFVYVGRLSREKGTDVFARAAEVTGTRAVFVGDGPLKDSMIASSPKAEFTGWLSRSDVRARLQRARALVLPSRWYEASPLVVPEASALGIPSIVSDVCAARYSIIDGVTGLTFRSGDHVDLGLKLTALNDPALARLMGRAAYDKFWSNPPLMPRHVSELRDVYETILSERF